MTTITKMSTNENLSVVMETGTNMWLNQDMMKFIFICPS